MLATRVFRLHNRPRRELIGLLMILLSIPVHTNDTTCRYIPGDDEWPTTEDWQELNATVGGRLIATIPQASVCHSAPYSHYDESACAALQPIWGEAQAFELKPAEIMNPYYQNQSCDPFTNASVPCELGNYASYSVNVTGASDVVASLRFVKDKNIRLVIKNTGHDYNGKSTGKGALSLWTHNLKSTEIITNYTSKTYSGPAIRLGAGIIGGEAYEAAAAAGYRVVGGECASVGIVGGFSQGGGHSILSSAYGMGSDQVLEWEVVTARGEHLVATPERNADLYWALSGGGGGTYGVVLGMTSRLYKDGPMTGGSLSFTLAGARNNTTTYWKAVSLWFQQLPKLTEDGRTVLFEVLNETFAVVAFNLPDVDNSSVVQTLLAPYTVELDTMGVTFEMNSDVSTSYLEFFNKTFGPLPYGPEPVDTTLTSRLIPRATVADDEAVGRLMDAFRSTVADGTYLVGCNSFSLPGVSHPDNAVLPAWRDAIALCNVNAYWDYTEPLESNLAVKKELVEVYQPLIDEATPGSGVYLNEIDPWYMGDWKQAMYGENYDRLLRIKHQNDPNYLLFGHFAVGGDEFTLDGSGRLCLVRNRENAFNSC